MTELRRGNYKPIHHYSLRNRVSTVRIMLLILVIATRLYASDPPGTIRTVAGGGSVLGDGGPATAASLSNPTDAVADSAGNLYIADYGFHRIRKVDAATGVISTLAGTGNGGFSGDGGAATAAMLQYPNGLALAPSGDIYIADTNNHRIRRLNVTTGVITTVVGNGTRTGAIDGVGGNPTDDLGDGGPATAATLYYPYRVQVSPSGDLYIADTYNHRIRKVDVSTGTISTVVGDGTPGCSGEGVAATSAGLADPIGIGFDSNGNLFIASWGCHIVRKMTVASGTLSTVAGMGPSNYGFSGDGGPAVGARLFGPEGIGLDADGNIFIADEYNGRIRRVDRATGIITSVAGGGGSLGDGGPATSANLNNPGAITTDSAGNLYIADQSNNRIRRVNGIAVPRDSEPPQLACAAADGVWHPTDVSVACTATDSVSGLLNPLENSFYLTTGVSNGTEDPEASTGTREVCDQAGNCATAGPVTGNMVDKKAPQVHITVPLSGSTYTIGQNILAAYNCDENGSGLASCLGPVASGTPINTSSAGSKTFVVSAADLVGNTSSDTVSYKVGFQICLLYDWTKVHKAGSTIPIKISLCDALGHNVSSVSTVVTATGLVQLSTSSSGVLDDSGSANPDNNFRYDVALQGYVFNLKTTGLGAGIWVMTITVADDSTPHTSEVKFQIKN